MNTQFTDADWFEPILNDPTIERTNLCGTTAHKYNNGHSNEGVVIQYCGNITCPRCIQHRVNNTPSKIKWLNSESFIFKILTGCKIHSPEEVKAEFNQLHSIHHDFHEAHPGLWYRVALCGQGIVIILKSADTDKVPGIEITKEEFIRDYVDFSYVDNATRDVILLEFKGKKRLLGHGKTKKIDPESFVLGVNEKSDQEREILLQAQLKGERLTEPNKTIALKRKARVIPASESKQYPTAKYYPVEEVVFVVEDRYKNLKEIRYHEFVKEQMNGNYTDEWIDYMGFIGSKTNQAFLRHKYEFNYLKMNDEKWKFLSIMFEKNECTF